MLKPGAVIMIVFLVIILSACTPQTQVVTIEVTRIVPETQIVTVEVPRIIRETQIVFVEVTPDIPRDSKRVSDGVSLLVPRSMHTATSLIDGRVLIVGGSQNSDQHLASAEIYDSNTNTITYGASLNTPRHGHTATLLQDGRVLVIGGYNLPRQWLNDAEIYDPIANSWTVLPPIFAHGVNHTATVMQDGRVLVAGGCIGNGLCTDKAEIFDPAQNLWVEATPMDYDRASHFAVLLDNGNVLIAGGASSFDPSKDRDALLYNPMSDSWSLVGQITTPRLYSQASQLENGQILVVGGWDHTSSAGPQALASAEIFDPISNTWSMTGSLSMGRYGFTKELLPDGRVMVAGGVRDTENNWTQESFVHEIEIYDPVTGIWAITGTIAVPSVYADSVILPNGQMWVTGGRTHNSYQALTWLINTQ